MKIKLFLPILLLCFYLSSSISFAFDSVQYHHNGGSVEAFMDSSYSNDDFHIPPHSDDSTTLVYYFSLPSYNFGYEAGKFKFYFYNFPELIFNSSSSSMSYVYTYDLELIVAGNSHELSGSYKFENDNTRYPTLQSSPVYDFNGHCYLKFTVHLTYTNMGSDAVIGSFNLKVPAFDMEIIPLNYYNPIYYLDNLVRNLSNGISDIISKIDESIHGFDSSEGDSINSDFNDTVADLDQAEDNLFALADNQINYSSYEDFFKLSSVEGAIGFVSSWMQSIYVSLGVFGMPILIGLLLIVVTRIIGYQNFSAGGG